MFALSKVPKDMGLENTVDEGTRQIFEFICTIESFPGGDIYSSDTEIINSLSFNSVTYDKVKAKACVLHFDDFKYLLLYFFSQYSVSLLFFVYSFQRLSHVYLLLLNITQPWNTLLNSWTTLTIQAVHKFNVSTFSVLETVLYKSTKYWIQYWSGSLDLWSKLSTLVLIFQISISSSRLSYNQTPAKITSYIRRRWQWQWQCLSST